MLLSMLVHVERETLIGHDIFQSSHNHTLPVIHLLAMAIPTHIYSLPLSHGRGS